MIWEFYKKISLYVCLSVILSGLKRLVYSIILSLATKSFMYSKFKKSPLEKVIHRFSSELILVNVLQLRHLLLSHEPYQMGGLGERIWSKALAEWYPYW